MADLHTIREDAGGHNDGTSYSGIASLEHHWPEVDDDRKATYAQLAIVVR